MRDLGINDSLLRVIHNFLSDRYALVYINSSFSSLKHIPVGCAQGSVLGPVLFNIYTSQLSKNVNPDFMVSYADDTYIAVSYPKKDIFSGLWKINLICEDHINWLESIGMVYNPQKTEFIIFGRNLKLPQHPQLRVKSSFIEPRDQILVLGIKFSSNLSCKDQVLDNIKSANAQLYALRYLNNKLNRKQFKQVVHAHYLSRVMYAPPLWARNVEKSLTRKISSCIYRVMRLYCKDFNGSLHREDLVKYSGIRNFVSQRIVAETCLLQRLVFNKNGGYLTDRLNQQCYTNSRHKGFMSFKCFARHRPGSISFLHHAKFISELIRFPWVEIYPKHFKIKIKSMIPFMVK